MVAARVRRELQGSADAAINLILDLNFWHSLTTIMIDHYPLFAVLSFNRVSYRILSWEGEAFNQGVPGEDKIARCQ